MWPFQAGRSSGAQSERDGLFPRSHNYAAAPAPYGVASPSASRERDTHGERPLLSSSVSSTHSRKSSHTLKNFFNRRTGQIRLEDGDDDGYDAGDFDADHRAIDMRGGFDHELLNDSTNDRPRPHGKLAKALGVGHDTEGAALISSSLLTEPPPGGSGDLLDGAALTAAELEEQRRKSRDGKKWYEDRPMLWASVQTAAIFAICTLVMAALLWIALPPVDAEHRDALKIPKNFKELQELNKVLKIYKDTYFFRVVICFACVYFFLQAFILPGSMYMSILGGAIFGFWFALPFVCFCMATGATMNYLLSAVLAPAILVTPKWQARLAQWSERVNRNRENLISYLIVLRLAPLPPHWVVNVVCPHLGIRIPTFWISTFLGIMPVSIIHTQIGTALDEMTSPADFHLFSWRNFFGLAGVVVAVMIPVGLRYMWKKEIEDAGVDEGGQGSGGDGSGEDGNAIENSIRPSGNRLVRKEDGRLLLLENDEEDIKSNYQSVLAPRAKLDDAHAKDAPSANGLQVRGHGSNITDQPASPAESSPASSTSTAQDYSHTTSRTMAMAPPDMPTYPSDLYRDDVQNNLQGGILFNSSANGNFKSDPLS